MAEEKDKSKVTDQETITPAGGKEDELSEKELEEAAGGGKVFPKVVGPTGDE
jgi:hypothetical protein